MDYEVLFSVFKLHKGKIIGIFSGLLFGILVLLIGFWRSIFISLCISLGFWLGSIYDNKDRFLSILDRILPTGLK